MTKSRTRAALFFAAAGMVAFTFGLYVYPVYPAIVWTLLFVCWVCYRLKMRAVAEFSSLSTRPSGTSSYWPDDEDEA